jgi:hypothetical protein
MFLINAGKEFHSCGAAELNNLAPSVERNLIEGTAKNVPFLISTYKFRFIIE